MADRSAIAGKSELIVEALRSFDDVDVDVWFPPNAGGRTYFAGQREMVPGCESALARYDEVVYCIGDYGRYHARILEAAWTLPGTVALHDVSLANLFYDLAVIHGMDWLRRQILTTSGADAEQLVLTAFARADGWPGDPYLAAQVPMLAAALHGARAVITHSRFAAERVREQYLGDVTVVGLPTLAAGAATGSPARHGAAFDATKPVVLQAGQLNPNKRTDVVIEAFGRRRLWDRATLAVVGHGTLEMVEGLRRQAHRLDIERSVKFLGPVDDAALDTLRRQASIAVVLRDPCLEAASAGLLDSFAYGLPCVGVDHGMYAEVPDACVHLVAAPPSTDDVVEAIERWIDDPESIAAARHAAFDYLATTCSPNGYALAVLRVAHDKGATRAREMLADGIAETLAGLGLGADEPTIERMAARAHDLFARDPLRLPSTLTQTESWADHATLRTPAPIPTTPARQNPAHSAPVDEAPADRRSGDDASPLAVSYAQNGEDIVLGRGLRSPLGFYVDIGAFDPDEDSVTRVFYDRGWWGINVDPVPEVIAKFRLARPRDVNVQAAITTETGKIQLWTGPPGLVGHSTLDASIAKAHREDGVPFRSSTVEAMSLAELLDRYVPAGVTIDFLKVDVEGHEHAVLASGDWGRWRPRVVVVEALAPYVDGSTHASWEPTLLAAGYSMVLFDGLNRFYVADGEPELAELLGAPASVVDRFTKVSVLELERYARHLERAYADLNSRANHIERRVEWLDNRLRHVGVDPSDVGAHRSP